MKWFKRKLKPVPKRFYRFLSVLEEQWEGTEGKMIPYKFHTKEEAKWTFPWYADKNEICVGVYYNEREESDTLYVTCHRHSFQLPLGKLVNELSEDDLQQIGLYPKRTTCTQCGEFSTWISWNGLCMDCNDKEETIQHTQIQIKNIQE